MAITKVSPGLLDLDSGITITTADNTTQLTLISTDADANKGPVLDLYRNSSSPADADSTGRINFQGENSAGETITYSQIFSSILDVTDGTEDGRYKIGTMVAGSFDSRMDITNTETIFNDDSKDLDFRVESNDNANALFVEGATGNVGIGVVPAVHYGGYEVLDIGDTLSLISNNTSTNVSTLTNNGYLNADASAWVRKVTDEASMYSQVNGDHRFSTAGAASAGVAISWSEKIRFQAAGGISFNGDTAAANALDDYEEGNWTPVFNNFTATGTTSNTGLFVKVGNLVYVELNLSLSSPSYTGGGSGTYITGLPYAPAGQLIVSVGASTLFNTATYLDNNGGGTNLFFKTNRNTISGIGSVSFMNSSGNLRFSATYYTTA